jgi:hypothetical protein
MRYLTIILAVGFGMMLCWVMLFNQQMVQVRLDRDGSQWFDQAVYAMPMWQVIFWAVALGVLIGFLLTWGGASDGRRRLRTLEYDKEAAAAEDDEPDYVVGLTGRRR